MKTINNCYVLYLSLLTFSGEKKIIQLRFQTNIQLIKYEFSTILNCRENNE